MAGHDVVEEKVNPYGYNPSKVLGFFFCALFGASTILHLVQIILCKPKVWWCLPLVVGGFGELVGWAGRLGSSYSLYNDTYSMIQTCCLIISPSFFSAMCYQTLAYIIASKGPEFSRLSPKLYSIIFVCADLISLCVQAFGGAMAATASKKHKDTQPGSNVMLIGIIFQMFMMVLFTLLAGEFYWRVMHNVPHGNKQTPPVLRKDPRAVPPGVDEANRIKIRFLSMSLAWITVLLFVRSVYRTAELAQGWDGYLITHEVWFALFDAGTMALLMISWNIFHPGPLIIAALETAGARFQLSTGDGYDPEYTANPLHITVSNASSNNEKLQPGGGKHHRSHSDASGYTTNNYV